MPGGEIHATAIDTIRRGFPSALGARLGQPARGRAGRRAHPAAEPAPEGPVVAGDRARRRRLCYAAAAFVLFVHGPHVASQLPAAHARRQRRRRAANPLPDGRLRARSARATSSPASFPTTSSGRCSSRPAGARLGGVGRTATVMFSDLRGFTSFAETLDPARVINDPQPLSDIDGGRRDRSARRHARRLHGRRDHGRFGAPLGPPITPTARSPRPAPSSGQLERFNAWLHDEMGFEKTFRMGIGLQHRTS